MKIYLFKTIFFILISINVFSQKNIVISGTLLNNKIFNKVYLEDIIKQKYIDSAKIENNKFQIKANIEISDFYKLKFDDNNYILMVLSPGETIDVNVDINEFYKPTIKGSKNTELVYQAFGKIKGFDDELEQLSEKINNQKKQYLKDFILQNQNSLSSLIFLDQLKVEEDLDIFKKLDASLSKKYPKNFLVINLHNKIKSFSGLMVGDEAPEIDLPNPTGKNIKLSSLRGKYVLIDFWAAWCTPCRRESPNMVAIYNQYNKKGFEIFSVSLDKTKSDWENAITKDGLGKWTHVSDLKYWNSQAARDYGVDGIPFTVLIDKEGKIIAKGLRGENLKIKLAEIFNN
ncbi:MAG: AhpC/TSA family protein [Bacteroidales bacterium]|nr:AhpC/TSA family protein [Bacteroidales bacterium]MBN2756415.1 AhpC/TSA family protein [Bacteroidales bacterium]